MTEPRMFTTFSPGIPQTRRCEIQVNGIPPNLNDRLHWAKRNAIIARYRDEVAWHCKGLRVREPMNRYKVTATLVRTNGGPKDVDNAVGSLKPVIDGLVVGGLVVDDSPAHLVELVVRQERGGSRCVRLVVEEVL